ncbi:MAG: hypothetical protein IJW46_01350, partial [Clostridia bacterium]|nr:hypothetical protein [Clostridia bacterium]
TPTFCYLGEEFGNGSIILSNHEGTDAPMALEMYLDRPIRMWGAHEMNAGLRSLYRYQTKVYYCEKKHWHPLAAYSFCLIASPLTNLFYRGFDLISTYRDIRFYKTVKESIAAIGEGKSVVIFPEDSSEGYLKELQGFYGGFLSLAKHAYKRGRDVPIVVSYYQKASNRYIFDAPICYSELMARFGTAEDVTAYLLERCNALGRMEFDCEEKTAC